jgi:uncharacterized membrane protein
MERLRKIVADSVFVVQILILFILIFESSIVVPPFVQAIGRLHPLLLHLPIGLLLVTVILIFARRFFEGTSFEDLISFLLHLTALTASLTTIMGLLLSLEGTFPADQLWAHKYLGVTLSFLCWLLLSVRNKLKIVKPVSVIGVIVLIFTGHYGANLTHGEDFVLGPFETDEIRTPRVITDSTTLFTATIEPILEAKCYSCHNNKKAKGNLILSSLESIREGGKNGDVWKPHDAASSLIVKRLSLPAESKEHMPPKDKAQLTDDEIQFISMWIDAGADTGRKLKELDATDTLKHLSEMIISRYQQPAGKKPLYTFDFAIAEKIEKLSIPNRTVFQIAKNEPAVQADFYLRETYQKQFLEELVDVKNQLITVNLSNMPVDDADLKTLAKFHNLEVVNLNNTRINGDGLKELTSLPGLRSVSLSGTDISVKALHDLARNKSLRDVYIWNTPVTGADLETLTKSFPDIRWDIGYIPDANEILKLNVPMRENRSQVLNQDENIAFRHNLPGTVIRYAVGNDPDSMNSPVYKDPLPAKSYAIIKAKAFKEGWLSSDVVEFVFFKKGFRPDTVLLLTQPEEKYKGQGGITLIDGNKGLPDFYRHPAWIGFMENDLVANFIFKKNTPTIRNITLSYVRNPNAIFMPPAEVQVWAGDDPGHLELIKKVNPPESNGYNKTRIEGVTIDLPSSNFKFYKLVAKPLKKVASGNEKKRKVSLMVDEVFFN